MISPATSHRSSGGGGEGLPAVGRMVLPDDDDARRWDLDYGALKAQVRSIKAIELLAQDEEGANKGDDSSTATAGQEKEGHSILAKAMGKKRERQELEAQTRNQTAAVQQARLVRGMLDLTRHLDDEIEKVVFYYLKKKGELAKRLLSCKKRLVAMDDDEAVELAQLDNELHELLSEICDLLDFVCWVSRSISSFFIEIALTVADEYAAYKHEMLIGWLQKNLTSLRKLLKKLDQELPGDPKIATVYLQSRRFSRHSEIAELYSQDGIKALIGGVKRAADVLDQDMQKVNRVRQSSGAGAVLHSKTHSLWERDLIEGVPVILASRLQHLHEIKTSMDETFVNVRSDLMLERSNLERRLWGDEDDDDEGYEGDHHGYRRAQQIVAAFVPPPKEGLSSGLYLNLLGTFLYLLNYNIVIVSSAEYAEYLGAHASLSGVVIGSLPFAAIVSAAFYSWWTNYSFKRPLAFSVTLLFIGNILYALAYPFNSIPCVLLGRLVTGLGGIRTINRRYVADSIQLSTRTAASAYFVAAGALGMACGPALSIAFDQLRFTLAWGLEINRLTAPGWLMAILWFMYGIVLVIAFREPRHYNPRTEDEMNKLLLTKVEAEGLLSYDASSYGSLINLESGHQNATVIGEEEGKRGASSSPSIHTGLLRGRRKAKGLPASLSNPPPSHKKKAVGFRQVLRQIFERRTALCLWVYFLLKLVQEALFSSAPIVTRALFTSWPSWGVGLLFSLVCVAIIPVNSLMAKLSLKGILGDHSFLLLLEALSLVALLVVVRLPYVLLFGSYSPSRYVSGVAALFLLMNALEVIVLSLLSKVLSRNLRGTTFNAGLLATEAGTLGRVVGDASISAFGRISEVGLLDMLMLPLVFIFGATLAFSVVGLHNVNF